MQNRTSSVTLSSSNRVAAQFRWVPWSGAAMAAASGLVLVAIAGFLAVGATSGELDWWRLLTSATWDPARGNFGGAAMIWGTSAVAILALGLATPIGWAAAIAINELAMGRTRRVLRSACELLAVVPSIVYGLLGIAYVRPLVSRLFDVPGGDSLIAAGAVLAVMVLPTIVALSVDALAEVPAADREAAAACGLTTTEVIRSAVIPRARRGMRAAVLLALARAMGETIAVFLVVGRADGRLPADFIDGLARLIRPGQTLTTKLNGPESVLAGTSGPHWAALCGLGIVLLVSVATATAFGARISGTRARSLRSSTPPRGPRVARNLVVSVVRWSALAGVLALAAAVVLAVFSRGMAAFDPSFWWTRSVGASGGGIRDQLIGTSLLVIGAGVIAAPFGLGLGLVLGEYSGERYSRPMRTLTLMMGGVPSILLGLWGYWLFAIQLGWGRSWLAGAIVLAIIAVPPVAIAVAAAVDALPRDRREAAQACGLTRSQLVRSVVVPQAFPGLVTGLLLGLARAAGETAPLLFTATVFSGASALPEGIRQSPVASLPTHIFTLAQDSAEPAARDAAWGAAVVLVLVAGALVLAAAPVRRRLGDSSR